MYYKVLQHRLDSFTDEVMFNRPSLICQLRIKISTQYFTYFFLPYLISFFLISLTLTHTHSFPLFHTLLRYSFFFNIFFNSLSFALYLFFSSLCLSYFFLFAFPLLFSYCLISISKKFLFTVENSLHKNEA